MTPSDLLTVPGGWLLALLALPTPPEIAASDSEARADLVVTLGLGFWAVALVLLALAWRRWGRRHAHKGLKRQADVAAHAGQQAAQTAKRLWDGAALWGLTWRAQVVHGLVYAAAPLLWELAKVALFVVTLPFSVMGFGDRVDQSGGMLDHLLQPACWTFATVCPWPPGNGAVGAKLSWAVLAVAWVAYWRRTRGSR
jgi:hypothetical protein